MHAPPEDGYYQRRGKRLATPGTISAPAMMDTGEMSSVQGPQAAYTPLRPAKTNENPTRQRTYQSARRSARGTSS
jgi:hypothetical protein